MADNEQQTTTEVSAANEAKKAQLQQQINEAMQALIPVLMQVQGAISTECFETLAVRLQQLYAHDSFLNKTQKLILHFFCKNNKAVDNPHPLVAQCLGTVLGMFEQTCTVLPWNACKVAFSMSEFVSKFVVAYTFHC